MTAEGDVGQRYGPRCCLVVCVALIALVAGVLLRGPTYPRDKRAAFERLRRAGPEKVVEQGRALMATAGNSRRELRGAELQGPIAELAPVFAAVTSTSVYLRMGGGGIVGDYGFVVERAGPGAAPGSSEDVVAGLRWREAWDAPPEMRGVPADW